MCIIIERSEMYIVSHYARIGRNFYQDVKEGVISVVHRFHNEQVKKMEWTVESGIVTGYTTWYSHGKKVVIKYGEFAKEYQDNGLVSTTRFKKGSNRARLFSGEYKRVKTKLGKYEGTLIQKCYGGSMRAERFVYKGGKIAYKIYSRQKAGQVIRPNGKVWFKWTGILDFAYKGRILCGEDTENKWVKNKYKTLHIPTAKFMSKNEDILHLFRNNVASNIEVAVYDSKGRLYTGGKTENRQKVGKWLEHSKILYYIQGVAVSKKLYETPPEKLDVKEVMALESVQLKTSLLTKIGYTRVFKELKAEKIEKTEEGELYQIPQPRVDKDNRPIGDQVMKLLKVKCPSTSAEYVLRVPPQLIDVTSARQWTFKTPLTTVGTGDKTKVEASRTDYVELEEET
jgi:hypothetical protein